MKKTFLALALLMVFCLSARADEGMWLVNSLSKSLEARMQEMGLRLSAGEIYDFDGEGASLSNAVVSLDFACTGSVVSDDGLIITNHHCAYADVFALSTDEHNYLKDGYWAFFRGEEIPIEGKGVQFLSKVINVTDEVRSVEEEYKAEGKPLGSRKLSHILETKYEKEYGLDAALYSMWAGSEYYLALYRTYKDVRLVAAPPVSIAAFGGDVDNWEWPQHKGDFALYRVYTAPDGSPAEYSADNVPLKPSKKLSVSTKGYGLGDFTMVLGYPGTTNRYYPAARVESMTDVTLPVTTELRGHEMAIIKKWMDSDPAVDLMYSDWFFSLSNGQELYQGEVDCCHRFGVVPEKRSMEKKLQQWISQSPERSAQWGDVIPSLESKWSAIAAHLRADTFIRETMVRATRLSLVAMKLKSRAANSSTAALQGYQGLDLRVEKELFDYAAGEFYANVPEDYWGAYQKELWKENGRDVEAICAKVWSGSVLSDRQKAEAAMEAGAAFDMDPMVRFLTDVDYGDLTRRAAKMDGTPDRAKLGRRYTRALYSMRQDLGEAQYPDANSSMRLTYGKVCTLEPRDAVLYNWTSSAAGILEKYVPGDIDFDLKPYWKEAVPSYDGPVNFLTDNDITGGNSGSPVLDAEGHLIGLAFDGNKESLACDFSWTEGYNKCVCVDIRYVLFILKTHEMDGVLAELGF